MKRPKEPAANNADWVRVYIWRAHKMLSAALEGQHEGSRAWLPLPEGKERARYEGLKRAAEQLAEMVNGFEASGNAASIDAMFQFGILMGLAKDWNARRMRPISAELFEQRTMARKNLANENTRRKSDAEQKIIKTIATWQRRARGTLWKDGKPLPARKRAELFAKFSSYKPRSMALRRLFALADAGRLPDPPSV
jgi:hypothetical protein